MRTISLVAAVSVVLAGCGDRSASSDGGVGGTVVIASPGASLAIAPLAGDAVSKNISDQIYDRLAQIGPNLGTIGDAGFEPRLARSWTWAPDSLSIAFALDPRARWHDGQPVRASDVRFSLDIIKDPKTGSAILPIVANIDSVSVRDSLTAIVWFKQRSPEQFYDFVYQVFILPEHVLKDIPREQLRTMDVSKHLIGTGRFRMAGFDPGVRVELVADTANYRGRAKLDRVIWSIVADAGAGITQLVSGQADVWENLPADVIPQLDSARARPVRFPALGIAYMGMNLRAPGRPGTPHPVFGDRQVRRAISMALDRQAMLRNVFDTLGTLLNGPFPRVLADTSVQSPPFDRARAAALLDSAGWRAGPDGVRSKGGRPLAFRLTTPTSSRPRARYAVLIQEQLRAIGVRVDIDALEFRTFQERQDLRNFDAALMSFNVDPSVGGLKQNWGSQSRVLGGQNHLGYASAPFDAVVDSATRNFDPSRAQAQKRRAIQMLVDDAPAVWLYELLSMNGVHRRIRTVDMRADGWWAGLADWSIPSGERIDRDRIGLRPAQP
jgi:peptide/nickel transport system substrate-binding protein